MSLLFIFIFVSLLIGFYLGIKNKNVFLPFLNFNFGILAQALQFFIIYKAILFLGFPNYALGLSLTTTLISSCLSFILIETKNLKTQKAILVQILGFIFLGVICWLFVNKNFNHLIFQLHFIVKIFFLALIFTPILILNNTLFSFFLTQRTVVNPANMIAMETLGCGVGALLIPILMEDYGITLILILNYTICSILALAFFFLNLVFKK